MADDLRVTKSLSIPEEELQWFFSGSGGPGGQHANRANTRVEVRFDVARSAALGPRQRARLVERLGPVARAVAQDERSQARNRQLALERLRTRVREALVVRPPRRPTQPTAGSQEARLQSKRRRAQLKKLRTEPPSDD